VVDHRAPLDRQGVSDADQLFDVLADKTRRAAIGALLERPRSSGELARTLKMSQPALSRHLRALRRAGLVEIEGDEADARLRIYSIRPGALTPLRTWLDEAERLWIDQLAAFKEYAERGNR